MADLARSELTRLTRDFFVRPATEVAPELLGCILWHDSEDGLVTVRLTEVEAYQGESDPASHAYRGQTARNAVMFGDPGHAYVYFTYGMHFCVNLVCQPAGRAEAVLLRAGEVIGGTELARLRRRRKAPAEVSGEAAGTSATIARTGTPRTGQPDRDLARGPGRLCQALGIDRALDGADACGPGSVLGIGPPASAAAAPDVCSGPRIGITRAADRPWRYWLAGDNHVSGPRLPRSRDASSVTGQGPSDGTMHR